MNADANHPAERARPGRHGVIATGLSFAAGPVVAGIGSAALVAARDGLPDRLAVHWGAGGAPDRWAGFTEAAVLAVCVTVALPVFLGVLGLFMDRSARHLTAAVCTALALDIGIITFGATLAQSGGTASAAGSDAGSSDVPAPGLLIVVGLLAGAAAGATVARLLRPASPVLPAERPPLPRGAATLDLPTTTRVAWSGATRTAPGVVVLFAVAVAVVAFAAARTTPWLWSLVALVALLAAVTMQATVLVDDSGVRVRSIGGLTWSHVPLERIESAEVAEVRALRQFGGWGWRLGRDGRRGFITRSGPALVVHRSGEPAVVVTVDGAADAAAVVNTLVQRTAAL